MLLDSADFRLSPLACASVFPGQALYQDRMNRSSVHGKEELCGRAADSSLANTG